MIMHKQQHILFIGFVWPEPKSSAAGLRNLNLIYLFKSWGWEITFACAAADSQYAFDLSTIGVNKVSVELNNSSFDSFIKELNPAIVIFDRFITEEQFGWRVAEQCPEALRILDTIDLHCLRRARQQAVKEGREFCFDDLNSETAKREIASILRSDLSLIISEFEMELLKNHFKISHEILFYLPLITDSVYKENLPGFDSRKDFMFIGNFIHEPNWDAVLYLKNKIWDAIRKSLKNANVYIYGAYPSEKALSLHNAKEGFHILGRVEDSQSVFKKTRVCLAPLRFGAGIKGKLLDAMRFGTPSVTTSIGAEGINGNLRWNGFITDDPVEFIEKSIDLYSNQEAWTLAQNNGVNIVNQRFSKELYKSLLLKVIVSLHENLDVHRKKNFIGQILSYHTNLSTKYMARWIEEKNSRFVVNGSEKKG